VAPGRKTERERELTDANRFYSSPLIFWIELVTVVTRADDAL
jgi:hypothetical protein